MFKTKATIIKLVALSALFTTLPSFAVDVVKANIGESTLDQRISFKQEVLRSALEATRESYGEYEIEIHNYYMNAKRAFNELVPGETINVYYALTLPKWEKIATPIRIPVRRGLVSYRLLLIHEDSKELFSKVNTVEELKRLRAGLNDGWTSYEVMKRQDFKIVKVGGYDGMFNMLSVRRYDYLLRGVNEVFDEIKARQDYNKNLIIEPRLAVYMPSATYIFVSKQEPRLAKRLKEGLEIMVANGELERIFSKYYSANLEKAQLENRKILYIDNPLLPDTVPWDNKALWMSRPASSLEKEQDSTKKTTP